MASNPFKKHMPALGVEGKVSGADRKKIRRSLEKMFPNMNEEVLEAVLPSKAGDLVSVKLAAPRREIIYRHEGDPILIDIGKGELQPTVFALWRAPTMLPCVHVKHPAVTQYLVGGADLMLPGVYLPPEGLPVFNKEDLLAVCVHGNPCPVAIGTAGMSSTDAVQRKAGKLVEVCQAYGDCLWDWSGRRVPNDGFLQTAVVPVGLGEAGLDCSGYQEDANGQPVLGGGTGAEAGAEEVAAGVAAVQLGEADVARQQGSQGGGVDAASEGGTGPQGFPADMDALLEMTLLQAVRRSIKDDMLPMNSSVMWAQHMQPMRPAGSTLDVKKSKHKKMSTFLKAYGGKGGLFGLKEDKHSGDQVLVSVNRQHELLQEFRPYCLDQTAGGADGSVSGGPEQLSGGGGGVSNGPMVIEELWRPGRELRPVFEALGQLQDVLLTSSEAGDVAFAYVMHAQLTKNAPDERTIVLDAVLCDALYKGLIKKGDLFPQTIPKADLRAAFIKRCSQHTRITKGGEVNIKKGSPPSINVTTEKRQGHKVTRVVGMEDFLVPPEVFASECQRRFAASCNYNELPGKNQGHEVVVQGTVAEHMAAFLSSKFGIHKNYINVK